MPVAAGVPTRTGLTIEGGWGLGYTATVSGQRAIEGDIDATSVGFGVGGFLTPDMALLARVGPSHGYSVIGDGRIVRVTQTPLIALLEWFPDPAWMLGIGGGIAVRVIDDATAAGTESSVRRGDAFALRMGHGFANWESVGMRLTLELVLSRYDDGTLLASSLGFEVQSF